MVTILNVALESIPVTTKDIREATQRDSLLSEVYAYVTNGWPQSKKEIPNPEVMPFFFRKESLSTTGGCILFNERMVVPASFRHRILNQLHRGHPGIVRMKAIARSLVYWPNIDNQIEEFVQRCVNCASVAK